MKDIMRKIYIWACYPLSGIVALLYFVIVCLLIGELVRLGQGDAPQHVVLPAQH